jgi:hypothetical protein
MLLSIKVIITKLGIWGSEFYLPINQLMDNFNSSIGIEHIFIANTLTISCLKMHPSLTTSKELHVIDLLSLNHLDQRM